MFSTLFNILSVALIAASVWSLLIPAIELSEEKYDLAWFPALAGFCAGVAFLFLLDRLVPHLHLDSDKPEGPDSGIRPYDGP